MRYRSWISGHTYLADTVQEIRLILDVHCLCLIETTRPDDSDIRVGIQGSTCVFNAGQTITDIAAQCDQSVRLVPIWWIVLFGFYDSVVLAWLGEFGLSGTIRQGT